MDHKDSRIHISLFDIQNDAGTKNDAHYRVHSDVYRYIGKLEAVARAAAAVDEEWVSSKLSDDIWVDACLDPDKVKELTASLIAMEQP